MPLSVSVPSLPYTKEYRKGGLEEDPEGVSYVAGASSVFILNNFILWVEKIFRGLNLKKTSLGELNLLLI